MCSAIGIINYGGPNVQVKGTQDYRPVSAFSLLGRYRPVGFPISSLSNSGVNHIKVLVKTNPRSLLEHLGTGHHYNISSRRGKLHILPAKNMGENDFYSDNVDSYMYNMQAIEDANYPYAVLTPSCFAFCQDFSVLLDTHIESGTDVTMLYQNVDNVKEPFVSYDIVNLNKQKGVLPLEENHGSSKSETISLETYILSKELFMDLVRKAANIFSLYWFRGIVNDEYAELGIRGVAHRGFMAYINDFKSCYNANMDLLDYGKVMDPFRTDWSVYTRTNDSRPAQYYAGVSMKNNMVSNGCLVEGDTKNSVTGHRAIIKEGAVVKNYMVLLGAMIGEDVHIGNVIVDKKAGIVRKKELLGLVDTPLYVKRNDKVQWQEYWRLLPRVFPLLKAEDRQV